jgi:hypothetical protein
LLSLDLPHGARSLPEYWGTWFSPVGDGDVKETNLNIFCNLGASLSYLRVRMDIKLNVTEAYTMMIIPEKWLATFLDETKDFESELKESRGSAAALLKTIFDLKEKIPENWGRTIAGEEALAVYEGISAFETAFDREHHNLSVFTVTPKGIYNTRALIENPELKFPEKLRPLLPAQMLYDLKEAGRCLAFDIPTACAFHVCRGTEAVMLAYYQLLTKHTWTFKKQDWKIYIEQLCAEKAPKQITNRLEEIRALDRNAYIHPDLNVSLDDAPLLFELCTGVVYLMVQEMSKLI